LIAFILGYPVRWLQRHPRIQLLQAIILVLSVAFILLGLIAITVIPPD
jgi:predicted PurR-regulated permease PerM